MMSFSGAGVTGLIAFFATANFVCAADHVPQTTPAAKLVSVEPQEINDLLPNPGMGWQTFQRFSDEDKNLTGLPSTSAYFRFYWREIEPKEGQIDFGRFNELLAHAHRVGQKLAFRVMCVGSSEYMDVPAWLRDQGCRGVEFTFEGAKHWVPDFSDQHFQEAHFRLIRELGQHYDGHRDLDLVDIGSVGLWGEWHMSGTTQVDTGKPVPLPPMEVRVAILDAWCQAFPTTSKVILIGSQEGMAQTVARGCGWRADCFGDMGGFSKTWSHMQNFYLQQLTNCGAVDAWKNAPVAFESCWDMRKWKESGWDIGYIFDYGLRCHASYLNNKSAPIPEGTRGEIERFLRHLGNRLVVRSLQHPATVRSGDVLAVNLWWENVGVAPPYRDYRVAVRLTNAGTTNVTPTILVSAESIHGWLPGKRQTMLSLNLPPALTPGRYGLAVGVVDPASKSPAVRLAIAGRDADGWYPLSRIQVVQR